MEYLAFIPFTFIGHNCLPAANSCICCVLLSLNDEGMTIRKISKFYNCNVAILLSDLDMIETDLKPDLITTDRLLGTF